MSTKVRTNVRVFQWPTPSKTQLTDEQQKVALRRARVPVPLSDTELRAFARRRRYVFPWREIRFGVGFVGLTVLLYFDVYGFLAFCNRMGWFGGAR